MHKVMLAVALVAASGAATAADVSGTGEISGLPIKSYYGALQVYDWPDLLKFATIASP